MKKYLILSLAILLMAGCSSPKYTYNFDHYDYNSGRKPALEIPQAKSPATMDQGVLTASSAETPVIVNDNIAVGDRTQLTPPIEKKYSDMNKTEKKEFRKELKKEIKSYVKAIKNGDTVNANKEMQAMDHDLKLAIIFGAVGLTLTLFGGVNEAFWVLGVISIVVGVVFLIKWLVRQ